MKILGLVGPSGSGKTTLLVRMLPLLTARGLTVSTLKHTHHDVDLDQPGKDTHRHRLAGAHEVMLSTPRRLILQHDYRDPVETTLAALVARLRPVDLVLAEGFRGEDHPKLLVYRPAAGKPMPDPARLPGLLAIVTTLADMTLSGLPLPVLDIDDAPAVAAFALDALGFPKVLS